MAGEIQGMALQSYLFFGSANRLYQHVKALLAQQPDCRFLIFDFQRVTGIDSVGDAKLRADQADRRPKPAHALSWSSSAGTGARLQQRQIYI